MRAVIQAVNIKAVALSVGFNGLFPREEDGLLERPAKTKRLGTGQGSTERGPASRDLLSLSRRDEAAHNDALAPEHK